MKLRLWENDQLSRDYRSESQQVRIGRDPSCELVIDGAKYPKVSGLHAERRAADYWGRVATYSAKPIRSIESTFVSSMFKTNPSFFATRRHRLTYKSKRKVE